MMNELESLFGERFISESADTIIIICMMINYGLNAALLCYLLYQPQSHDIEMMTSYVPTVGGVLAHHTFRSYLIYKDTIDLTPKDCACKWSSDLENLLAI